MHLGWYTKLLLCIVCFVCGSTVLTVVFIPRYSPLKLLEVAELLGFVKVGMSASKYVPQLIYNQKRRSTKGWAINSTILDIGGGVLSLLQLVVDGVASHDIGSVMGNTSKIALALVTMVFDLFFLVQHFVLFRDNQPEVISLSDW